MIKTITVASVMIAASNQAIAAPDTKVSAQQFLVEKVDMHNGQPVLSQSAELYDELDFQQAVQAYIWVTSFVAFTQFEDAFRVQYGETNNKRAIF